MLLPEEIKKHLGMARVKDLKGLPDAFKDIVQPLASNRWKKAD